MNTRRGFTLIELLVVIAIIGVLSSIVLSSLNASRVKARDTARKVQGRQFQRAIETYFVDNGTYPVVAYPMSFDSASITSLLVPSYISSIPIDSTNTSGVTYYGSANGYVLNISMENQTQVSPSAYSCKLGTGNTYTSYYPTTPAC